MEMLIFILGWAGILLWYAAPFLLAAVIVTLALGGIAALVAQSPGPAGHMAWHGVIGLRRASGRGPGRGLRRGG